MNKKWIEAQAWELDWHSNSVNSFGEELKQLEYAKLMGLNLSPTNKTPYSFDLQGKSVLDLGSGPYSLLLKCRNLGDSLVSDPLMDSFPQWVRDRYKAHGLTTNSLPAEEIIVEKPFDCVLFYNVLEHTYDPEKIVKNAMKAGKIVRCFEWLDTRSNIGHPQTLTEENMNKWFGQEGKVQSINRGGANGRCYSGIFRGESYEEV